MSALPPDHRPGIRRRWWLILLAAPVALAVLSALALIAFILTVDPSRFRGTLEAEVQQQTGLGLQLEGRLRWRLWPLLAIESEGGALQAPLLTWKHLVFSAPLTDLIHRRWNLQSLRVEGLRLQLRRDAQGRGNWELPDSGGPATPLQLRLDQLVLEDATLSYEDARTASRWEVGPLGLTLAATVERQPPDTRLAVPAFRLALADSTVQGSVQGLIAGESAKTALQGRVVVMTASLRALLQALGTTLPATRDASVFGATQLSTDWTLAGQQLRATAVRLQLDDTQLAGTLTADLAPAVPRLQVELKGDTVDLDRYLAQQLAPGAHTEPFTLPIATLKSLPVTGVIELASARGNGVVLKGVKLRFEASP